MQPAFYSLIGRLARRIAVKDSQQFRFLAIRHYNIVGQRDWQPALNIYETEQDIIIVIELAGIDPNTLFIDAEPGRVRIEGVRQFTPPEGLRRIHQMEIASGAFQISTTLSALIDPEQAHSHYHHGLLEVVLPLAKQPPRRVALTSEEGEER
jgi:HSP20 family molecular chaperone IbpA